MASQKNKGACSQEAPVCASRPTVMIDATLSGAWERVGGIPLIARSLFHLGELQMERVFLLLREDRNPTVLKPWLGSLDMDMVRIGEKDTPETILALMEPDAPCLFINASHLIDPRLLAALVSASRSTLVCLDRQDVEKEVVRAGFLRAEDLRTWIAQGPGALIQNVKILSPADLDPYSSEIRGPVVPYFMEVRSGDDASEATRLLIRSQQKQVMDFPAQFIDPPFENALTRFLCHTPVTPNMVTYAGVALAMGVAYLFWHGYFLAGAFGTFAVEILDGVDGKLARTKLEYSRLGRHEAFIDYFCENSWYVALGVGLGGLVGNRLPALLAGMMILSDTMDNVFYTLAGKWYDKSIDLFSPFDAAFRRVAGRRNIYGMMFILGFLAGFPLLTFGAAAFWAALTAGTHGFRLMQHGKAHKRTYSQEPERIS